MGLKVLFWNINKCGNDFIAKLQDVCSDVDILLLAESRIDDTVISDTLGLNKIPFKSDFDEGEYTPKIYSRLKSPVLEHYSSSPSKRMCFYTLRTKEYGEIILVNLHFPSKASYDGANQLSIAATYSQWIREIELLRKHIKTIVVGDFNMNPFEDGMIQPHAFNSTLSAEIARNSPRTFHYEKYDVFYNPMWNWLGDKNHETGNDKIPGSHFFKTTTDVSQIYWNVFDKVIVRPDLIDAIDYSSLKIIETISINDLVSKKNSNTSTDHLPLTFTLKITAI